MTQDLTEYERYRAVESLRYEYEKEAFRKVLATEEGRAVINALYRAAGVDSQTFDLDPYQSAFAAGARQVGLDTREMVLHAKPDADIIIVREARERDLVFVERIDASPEKFVEDDYV